MLSHVCGERERVYAMGNYECNHSQPKIIKNLVWFNWKWNYLEDFGSTNWFISNN